MLDINKQLMKYSQHGQKVTIYEKDDDGNIKYYVDGDGNKIPLIADEKVGFSEPKEFYANISNKLSEVLVKEFGVDDSSTYVQIVTDKG
jgi:signal transduction histidine kinase